MSLDTPAVVHERLSEIDRDLQTRQNEIESAAWAWYMAKRDREKRHAEEFLGADGTVAERNHVASLRTCQIGAKEEAEFEALKAVCRVLDTRAAIGMSILRSHGRVSP